MKHKHDEALLQAGRMSNAVDKMKTALKEEDANCFGKACAQLLRAKVAYDREIERLAARA